MKEEIWLQYDIKKKPKQTTQNPLSTAVSHETC